MLAGSVHVSKFRSALHERLDPLDDTEYRTESHQTSSHKGRGGFAGTQARALVTLAATQSCLPFCAGDKGPFISWCDT